MCGQVAPLVLLTPIFPFRLLGSMQLLTLALVRMSATLLLFSDCSLQRDLLLIRSTTLAGWVGFLWIKKDDMFRPLGSPSLDSGLSSHSGDPGCHAQDWRQVLFHHSVWTFINISQCEHKHFSVWTFICSTAAPRLASRLDRTIFIPMLMDSKWLPPGRIQFFRFDVSIFV